MSPIYSWAPLAQSAASKRIAALAAQAEAQIEALKRSDHILKPPDCTNCDGRGFNTGWPHTTCPMCNGTGHERAPS